MSDRGESGDDDGTASGDAGQHDERAGRLDEKEERLKKQERELERKERELKEREQELLERREETVELREQLEDKEAEFEEREENISDRETALDEQERQLEQRAEELDQRERTLREYVGDQIADLEGSVQSSIDDTVSAAVKRHAGDGGGRFSRIGGLVLGFVGMALVIGGVVVALAIRHPDIPAILETDLRNLAAATVLVFSGLAANAAAVAGS
jgi:ribonuclease Y